MQQEINVIPDIDPRFDPLATMDDQMKQNRWAKDDKLFVRFWTKPLLNPRKSTDAGRPIYDEVDYITIRTPGNQLSVIESRVIGTKYEQRFAKQYAAWKQNRQDTISGTPLEAFPFLMPKIGLIAELKAININTVEQLAGIADTAAQSIMGGYELRKRAQEWIESTTGTDAKLAKMEAENEALRQQMVEIQAQLKASSEAEE